MPSPFPGMDPYLESPALWPDVHHALISEMQAILNRTLRPRYHVRVEERVYISDESDPGRQVIIPDLRVAEIGQNGTGSAVQSENGGVAVEVAEPLVVTTMLEEELHEAFLEIIDASFNQVVTVIEVLSPTNKVPGSRGRDSYQTKRAEVMKSPSHLVEIDLLRRGDRFTVREILPPHDYLVHVSRVDKRPKAVVWPIRLTQKLPSIDVPLKGDASAKLDLQAVLTGAYDRAAYDMVIDYRKDPVPPLDAEQAAWSAEVLKSRRG